MVLAILTPFGFALALQTVSVNSFLAPQTPRASKFTTFSTTQKNHVSFVSDDDLTPSAGFEEALEAYSEVDLSLGKLMNLCREDDPVAAQELLERLLKHDDIIDITPKHFTTVIDAWGRAGRIDKAEALFDRMKAQNVAPTRVTFHVLMSAHIRAGNLAKAQTLLAHLEDDSNELQPFTTDYNVIISGCAREGRVAWAESILKRMVDRCVRMEGVNEECECEPDMFSYSHLLEALAESGQKGAGERAEEILNALESRYEDISPVVYNTVLKVWKNNGDCPEAAARAEKILKRMVDLRIADRISYTAYIATLANRADRESAQRANEIADQMLRSYQEGGNSELKPNSLTWNGVIYAWVRCGDMNRAVETLRMMEQLEADGEMDMAPNAVSYSTIMDGFAKSKEDGAVEKAEQIFRRMSANPNEEAHPNQWTYVTLIHLYARQRNADTAQKAEDLIFEMFNEYQNGNTDLKPNTQLVTAVMDAWVKSGAREAAEKAEALLNWMISFYEEEKDSDLEPNEYSFSTAISAWGKSQSIGKSLKARRILNRLIELHGKGVLTACPNTICYTAVINACAYCENNDLDKRDSLQIAIGTYKDLERSSVGRPNHVTYSTILTAIRNLLPISPKRSTAIQNIFHDAAKNGFVDRIVLERARSGLSVKEFRDLIPSDVSVSDDGRVYVKDLPYEWRRNVSKNTIIA